MRGDLTDAEWAIIGALLPPERGRWGLSEFPCAGHGLII